MTSRIRIIGGRWKRTPLPVPDADGLRPTPDRVRETLYNWLGQDLAGRRCLDLFAGTGALGFEAASRGAAQVVMVERDARLVRALAATRARLDANVIEIVQADASAWLDRPGVGHFDLILLDPPFRSGWIERMLPRVRDRLADGGRLYVEAEAALTDERLAALGLADLAVIRDGKAGQVHYHLLAGR